jgi:hypothetical protein
MRPDVGCGNRAIRRWELVAEAQPILTMTISNDRLSPALRDVERSIDRAYLNNPLLAYSRPDAAWYLLGAAEDALALPLLQRRHSPFQGAALVDETINDLRHALAWIFTTCPPGGPVKQVYDQTAYDAATALLELAGQYDTARGGYRGSSVPGPRGYRPTGGSTAQGAGQDPGDSYPYQALPACPAFLAPGSPVRSAVLGIGFTTDFANEVSAWLFNDGRGGLKPGNIYAGDQSGVSKVWPPPPGAIADAHLHPGPYNTGNWTGQGPTYGDADYTRNAGWPGFIGSQDSLFWINPAGDAYGCEQ